MLGVSIVLFTTPRAVTRGAGHMVNEKSQRTQNGTMFVDLDWALNASRRLSASAELLVLIVLLFVRTTFCVFLVFVAMCSVFWLFWLSYQYLPSDWLERLLWGSLTVARGSSPSSPGWRVYDFLGLLYSSIVFWCGFLVPCFYMIYFILLWHDIACLWW